jgi:hypothetical protein
MVGRRRGEGWEVVVVADDGRRVTFKVQEIIPSDHTLGCDLENTKSSRNRRRVAPQLA